MVLKENKKPGDFGVTAYELRFICQIIAKRIEISAFVFSRQLSNRDS
jgi:hypothetical protein